jgi:membrane-associated phospholipid phosphatase
LIIDGCRRLFRGLRFWLSAWAKDIDHLQNHKPLQLQEMLSMTYWRRFTLLLFSIIWFALAAQAAEDTCQDPSTTTPSSQSSSSADLKLTRFPTVLVHNLTSNLFTRGNLLPFLIGSAAALAISPADQEISRSMYNHAPEFGDAGDTLGSIVPASITGGAFFASRLTKNEHFRSFGYTIAQAYLTNGILTQGLKYATHRMRPDGSDSKSLPSGHTSSAFTVATVVTNYYGKKWGIPLYVFAGLVGASRIEKGQHWPSDVIAGAALGYISGRTAILGTKREISSHKTARLMIIPTCGHDWRGVSASISY